MAEREVVLDEPVVTDEQAEALRQATERAERAEAELAKLKHAEAHKPAATGGPLKTPPSPSTELNTAHIEDQEQAEGVDAPQSGEAELRKDSMMAHLLDSLAAGKDIGHYGRLVFAMVARRFLAHDEVLAWMMKDRDVDEEKARLMLRQVEGRDYNPPRRDKILSYQAQQDFPILPYPDDPDCGNLYRNLKFPDEVYEHIGHYQEAKMDSEV
jgi:hypothetical protein